MKTVILRNTDLRDAHMNQQDIFSYSPNSNAGQAYERLIEEIFPSMNKQYNIKALSDDLSRSAFFREPAPPASPPPQPPEQPASPSHRSGERPNEGTPQHPVTSPPDAGNATRTPRTGRTSPTPARRQMIRHPFEIYQDQVEQLRQLALQDRMSGGTGSMSQMVREAIDWIIKERSDRGEE